MRPTSPPLRQPRAFAPTIFIGLFDMDLSKRDLSSIIYEMSAASNLHSKD